MNFYAFFRVILKIGKIDHALKTKALHLKYFFCTPESFNTNISHQLLDYTITFENSKGDFVIKNRFRLFILKISGIQK